MGTSSYHRTILLVVVVATLVILAWWAADSGDPPSLPPERGRAGDASAPAPVEKPLRRDQPADDGLATPSGAAPASPEPARAGSPTADPVPSRAEPTEVASADASRATVTGSLRWHESMGRDPFAVTYRRAGAEQELPVRVDPSGTFAIRGRPGPIDVLVRMQGDDTPLHVVAAVPLPGGDARLAGLDVTDVRRVELTLVDGAQAPIDGVLHALAIDPDGAQGTHVTARRQDGVIQVLLRRLGQQVEVWADGHGKVRVPVWGDQQVELPGSATVRIRVVVDDKAFVTTHLQRVGDPVPSGRWPPREPQQERMGTGEVPAVSLLEQDWDRETGIVTNTYAVREAGDYLASWSLFKTPGPDDQLGPEQRQPVYIERPVGTYEVELYASAEALEAAREDMVQRVEADRAEAAEAEKKGG